MLPAVSAHASLISFREEKEYNPHNYFLSVDEIKERINASNIIRSLDGTIVDERCLLLNMYDIRFVIAESNNAEQYVELMKPCKKDLAVVFKTKDLVMLEFQ
jgi:hypothetical protein